MIAGHAGLRCNGGAEAAAAAAAAGEGQGGAMRAGAHSRGWEPLAAVAAAGGGGGGDGSRCELSLATPACLAAALRKQERRAASAAADLGLWCRTVLRTLCRGPDALLQVICRRSSGEMPEGCAGLTGSHNLAQIFVAYHSALERTI